MDTAHRQELLTPKAAVVSPGFPNRLDQVVLVPRAIHSTTTQNKNNTNNAAILGIHVPQAVQSTRNCHSRVGQFILSHELAGGRFHSVETTKANTAMLRPTLSWNRHV